MKYIILENKWIFSAFWVDTYFKQTSEMKYDNECTMQILCFCTRKWECELLRTPILALSLEEENWCSLSFIWQYCFLSLELKQHSPFLRSNDFYGLMNTQDYGVEYLYYFVSYIVFITGAWWKFSILSWSSIYTLYSKLTNHHPTSEEMHTYLYFRHLLLINSPVIQKG